MKKYLLRKGSLLLLLLLGLTACGGGETYASLAEVREDIAFYDAEILKEVAFDDYIVFFVAEEQEQSEDLDMDASDFFGFRLFQMKKNGEFLQKEHSVLVPEGSVFSHEWKELFGDTYRIQYSVHEADTEPFGAINGKWIYAETGDHGKWHFSYEILKQDDAGAMVPVGYQYEKTLMYR